MQPDADVVLVVDVANVMGSRPDGWWRDRAGAATRLMEGLGALAGTHVDGPAQGDAPAGDTLRVHEVVAVLEGRSRDATAPENVRVVRAPFDGDTSIVAEAQRLLSRGLHPLVVTADRGLRNRLPGGSSATGPGWLNDRLGR